MARPVELFLLPFVRYVDIKCVLNRARMALDIELRSLLLLRKDPGTSHGHQLAGDQNILLLIIR